MIAVVGVFGKLKMSNFRGKSLKTAKNYPQHNNVIKRMYWGVRVRRR